jgi:6-phosphogluconolactonase (cycloisomerase 2 family)
MKFRKFGKALLVTAISAGVVFGISSCVQSYTVGYLYVTGNQTSSTTGQGVISGFKIDHNTGKLTNINGLPISSGGANPGRAVLLTGGRFVYVLNQGVSKDGAPCSPTDPCQANITQFSIGGNGILAPQGTYFTQGLNPFRLLSDASGTHLYVLDHDAPDNTSCSLVFGAQATSCGDITVFSIDATTGRLSYVLNSQVTSASGSPLPYFPVPVDPIDFVQSGSFMLTMSGTPTTPGGDTVFPYTYSATTGQLTVNQNSSQPLGISYGNAIVTAASVIYVLDNGLNTNSPATNGQIYAYTAGTNGALIAENNGYNALDPTLSNPNYAIAATAGGKSWLYVLAEGDDTNTTNTQSGISAFDILSPFQLTPIASGGQTAGTGAGPQCILEDPSNQYIYTANFNDSTVTGLSIDQNAGILRPLSSVSKAKDSYALPGPAAWCVVTGRTS